VYGSQTAVVVGPSGEEIYVDKHGRVKVQFHWDREGHKDDKSSCWIRVSTAWAGKGWGAIHLPRIGQEVIVDFLEGDPDQPIITGRVYNDDQTVPYDLPANKTQSGVKSRSSKSGGTADFNEIRMEDKAGSELLYVHAQKDKQVMVENDRTEEVGRDEKITIKRDRIEAVERDEKITITRDRTEEVGRHEKTTVKGNREDKVEGNETNAITGNRKEAVDGLEEIKVGQNRKVKIGMADKLEAGTTIAVKANVSIELKVGANSIKIDNSGITIKGIMVKIEGSAMAEMKAPMTTVKGDGMVQVKAPMTQVNGDGLAMIKGGVTMIN
jgi:type VI secretion system secreted protein VgrG